MSLPPHLLGDLHGDFQRLFGGFTGDQRVAVETDGVEEMLLVQFERLVALDGNRFTNNFSAAEFTDNARMLPRE